MKSDGSEYEGKPRTMRPGERFYIWDFIEHIIHPCEIHIAGDEQCQGCRDWLMGSEVHYPQRCGCGGLQHFVRSWLWVEEVGEEYPDEREVETIQCDQCGQEGFK